jgi:hypothetical protein
MVHSPSLAAFTPRLVAALQSGDRDIPDIALLLMGRLPQHALAPHAPALARRLGISSSDYLTPVLTKLDLCVDPEVRADLCKALASDNFQVRVDALCARDAPHSRALIVYIPALIKVLLTFKKFDFPDDYYANASERPEEKMRWLALRLLRRVDPSELVEHIQPVFVALSDTHGTMVVREMAMHAVSLVPASAVAPYARLLLSAMMQPDDKDSQPRI